MTAVFGPMTCAACRGALQAGAEHVAALASHGPVRCGRYRLCHRHLRGLLARLPEASRAGVVASLLDSAAAAATARRRAPDCEVCAREDAAARQAPAEPLCIPHLRRFAGRLQWDGLATASSRLLHVLERGRGGEVTVALEGHPHLLDPDDGDHACPVCEARAGARLRHYEWLADVLQLSPSRALGGAVALCASHVCGFTAWDAGPGQALVELAAGAWAKRLRLLIAGLDDRPRGRLIARLATLPTALSSMADDEGRLPLADIARATLTVTLRTPGAVLERQTAAAFGTGRCPACAAEDLASRESAARCRLAVCPSDLDLVDSVSPTRSARRMVGRATADRLVGEAAAARSGAAIDHATGLAAIRAVSSAASR